MRRVSPRKEKKGFYVHLPATNVLLVGMTACLIIVDAFLAVTHSYFPAVTAFWLARSQPLTDFMAQFNPAISGVGIEMAHRGYAARIPLMQNLIACNSAILWTCYAAALLVIPVEALPKRQTIAHDIEAAVKSWGATLSKLRASLWLLLAMMNLPLLISWTYSRPYALYESDPQIPFVCFLFFAGILTTPRWILFHALLFGADSRRILSPPESPDPDLRPDDDYYR